MKWFLIILGVIALFPIILMLIIFDALIWFEKDKELMDNLEEAKRLQQNAE